MAIFPAYAQETRRTAVHNEQINTLQVHISGEPQSVPLIGLNNGKQVEISFDAFGHDYNRFAYSVEHCDAGWTPSTLSPIEYLDGMPGLTIDDFAGSTATTAQYTNYRLLLPNDEVRLKVSGNYAVRIYRENNPNEVLLTACFSVAEPLVTVTADVTGNTLIDFNKAHQQVNFSIQLQNFPVAYPQTDLKIFVYQNRRFDNAVTNLNPTAILRDRIVYEQNRSLIFEAGNEYRRFEFLSSTYNGMNVDNIRFHNPYYHVTLLADQPRSPLAYRYDRDQNGRFLVRCSRCSEPSTEADYYFVHFALQTAPLPGGSLYLLSDIYNNVLDERSKVDYNPETRQYEKHVLLKQGNYNYCYLFVPGGQTRGQTAPIEGNFFQTGNEYGIYVYYRPFGARYDRLIGQLTINN
ncbi:DUF5103 domain-containing protein [Bacteroidia bacterium]|nr:DUF5103 domain-containing protein [Bacteroidia bacterium]